MKANELRIGNWIGQKDGRQFQVAVTVAAAPNFWKNNLDISHGIPVTDDWLIRFGFTYVPSKIEGNPDVLSIPIMENDALYFEDDEFVYFDGNAKLYLKFADKREYVHQVQNLYFSLTGEELTFKN